MTNKKSNLTKRIEKARGLQFVAIPGIKGRFGTRGSQGSPYQVQLRKAGKGNITRKNKNVVPYFTVMCNCQENLAYTNGNPMDDCKGNKFTVCYHCLGAFAFSMESIAGTKVSFYSTQASALKGINFGGSLFKLINESNGVIWAIVRKSIAPLFSDLIKGNENLINQPIGISKLFKQNVDLLRNTREEAEGID